MIVAALLNSLNFTSINFILSFDSHHPIAHKISVAKTLFSRATNVCSSQLEKDKEISHVKSALTMNGYPAHVLESSVCDTIVRSLRSEEWVPKATVTLPYIKHVSGEFSLL